MEVLDLKLSAMVLRLLIIAGLTVVGLVMVRFLMRRGLRLLLKSQRLAENRRQQSVTLLQVARWALNALIVGSALLMMLSTLGVNIAPLLASAGLAGLALTLAAQTVIKDLVNGVLILVENQYMVGDSIQVGAVSGDVERVTLRATYVRALNGDLVVVPNGDVRTVANQTRGWSRAVVEVGVAYEEDLERALGVLRGAAAAFGQEPANAADLMEPPEVQGAVSLGDLAVTVRVMVKTQPGKQAPVGRALRQALLAACDREAVRLAYPLRQVWVKG